MRQDRSSKYNSTGQNRQSKYKYRNNLTNYRKEDKWMLPMNKYQQFKLYIRTGSHLYSYNSIN